MREIDVATLFSATDLQDLDIHPDGRKAICSINNGANWELAILNLTSGAVKKLLAGPQSLMSPRFSPDGRRIAYHVDFEGNENHDVVVVRADGRGAKNITDSVEDNYSPQFSPDGKSVAFISNRVRDLDNLYTVGSKGGRIKRLTNEPLPVRQFAWSPDGMRIAYVTGVGDEDHVSVADTTRLKTKRLLRKRGVEYSLSGEWGDSSPWSPDGKSILFLSNEHDWSDIGQLDLASSKAHWVVKSKNDKHQPQWSPDGSQLAYLEVSDPDVVVKVRSDGKTRIVSPVIGTSRALHWLPDGSGVLFVNGSAIRPEEVFVAGARKPRRITKFIKKPLRMRALVTPNLINYKSFDGLTITAQLYVPKDRSRKAAIVLPHGGPEMMDTNIWDQLTTMLVDKGFTVMKPNYRGSTGYGRKFLHLHDGDLGGGDYKDTVWAGKFLLAAGYAEKDRLGYWGASYSGFTCMLALTKYPEMWAAGVSIVGFFDWATEHETERGYLKKYDESKMGDPKKNPELFRDRSPINFLQNLRAPLLMTASAKDVRCPPTESRAVVAKLRAIGKEVQYHEYPDEGHWPRKRKNLMDLYGRSARFLDERMPR
ncbi:MAG: S9 family peptidase [Thermoplasmata archaeon]